MFIIPNVSAISTSTIVRKGKSDKSSTMITNRSIKFYNTTINGFKIIYNEDRIYLS